MMPRECKSAKRIIAILVCAITVLMCLGNAFAEDKKKEKAPKASTKLQKRIDFQNAYILGQSIKSGAVYLLHRKQSDIKSMLEIRTDYRDEILEEFTYNDLVILKEAETDEKKDPSEKLIPLPKKLN